MAEVYDTPPQANVKQITSAEFSFAAWWMGTDGPLPGWKRSGKETTMGQQQLRTWRTGAEQTLWLTALIDAMEEVSRPELRAEPCDPFVLAALRVRLARPASGFGYYGSAYSLRN
jgi:hypothetical protein